MTRSTPGSAPESTSGQISEKLTTCDIMSASDQVSEMKKNFICQNDMLHDALLSSPWPVLMYSVGVLFIMFLVKRAADIPHRAAARAAQQQQDTDSS